MAMDPEEGVRPAGGSSIVPPARPTGTPVDLSEGAAAAGRGALILVVTDDGTSPWHDRTRRSAIELARSTGGRLLFYDRSAESRFVDSYASGPYTSDNEGSHGERMLDPAELRALGRQYLAKDIDEAAGSGVRAWAWLPRQVGPRAIAEAVARFDCGLVVVPAELGRRTIIHRPRPWSRPRSVVGIPVLVSGPDGSLRDWQFATELAGLEFEVRQLGFLRVRGRFSEFDVDLTFDEAAPEETRVRARIAASSLSTGLGLRDRALRSASFFDVANHPFITFTSSTVARSGGSYSVTGELTIKERSRSVELRGAFDGVMDAGGHRRATMRLATQVDRREWDLVGGFMVANPVQLTILAVAIRASADPAGGGDA